ncbi:MAG: hypothetical protein ACR2IV_04385 [Bryobacteraceae bacterium]
MRIFVEGGTGVLGRARILIDGAIAESAPVHVHESITFVYQDGGDKWLTEGDPVDGDDVNALRGALAGEQQALRFTHEGARGVILRFGGSMELIAPRLPRWRKWHGITSSSPSAPVRTTFPQFIYRTQPHRCGSGERSCRTLWFTRMIASTSMDL